MGKYKRQVGRLLTNLPRQRSSKSAMAGGPRFTFGGPNPATKKADMLDSIEYAIENELELEIHYKRKNGTQSKYLVKPKDVNNDKLYALVSKRGSHSNFFIDRIAQTALLEED